MKPLPRLLRQRAGAIAVLALCYYIAARLGLLLAFTDSNASPVWPPSGIAVGALLVFGRRLWPGVLAGAFIANVLVFTANQVAPVVPTLLVSCAIAVGNTLEALAAAWLLRRFAGTARPLAQIQNVYKFVLIAGAACLISAVTGTGALLAFGIIPPALVWTVWGTWWLGDTVGVLLIAPFMLAWRAANARTLRHLLGPYSLISIVALCALLYAIFGPVYDADGASRWFAYLVLPAIGWSAYRHGARGTTFACLITAASAVSGTINGSGPFATGTLNDALFSIQTFIALCCLVGMVLCADMNEVRVRNPDRALRTRVAAHWSILFLCLGVTLLTWQLIAGATETRARERFDQAAAGLRVAIIERMRMYEQGLRSGKALFRASESVERAEWHEFVDGMGIASNFPGIQGIGFAKALDAGGRAALEETVRADGFAQFKIFPPSVLERSMAIIYLEPFTVRNQRAFGFDLMTEPLRRRAILRAGASGNSALTEKVTLLQETGQDPQAGFLMFVPVYRHGAAIATPAQRQGALEGVVYSPFRMNDLMAGISSSAGNDIGIEVFDGESTAPEARMYFDKLRSVHERRDYPNPFVSVLQLPLQQHHWTLRVTSTSAFEDAIDRQKAQIVLVAGTLISLLFFGVVRALAVRGEFAAAQADQMRSALSDSERKFESLVDSAIEFSIIAVDLDGVIRVFSTGAQRMLGYAPDDLIGKQTPLLFHLPGELDERAQGADGVRRAGHEVLVATARSGGTERRDWTYVTREGARLPVSVVVTPIQDGGGRAVGFLEIAHNISEQNELQASLVRAKELAEAASRAKSEFVANMSHEIRTPMNGVLGVAHLLGKTPLLPEQRRYLDMIRTAGQSLLGIIDDVLDFSKIEAGRMELSPAGFDLNEVLDACASLMTVNAAAKDLELVLWVEARLPRLLHGDALRLQQVLTNLLSNAIKFTERGTVALRVEQIGRGENNVEIRFTVTDTGLGINDAQLGKLFAPFTQADASMTRRFGGTGLGLTISASLVRLMKGHFEVDSEAGQGSRFAVTLPFGVPLAPAARAAQASLPARHLLVADTHAASLSALDELVRSLGWSATLCANAEQLDAALQAGTAPYDAMLIDAALQALVPAPRVPCLWMTSGKGRDAMPLRGAAARAPVLLKPVTQRHLQSALGGAAPVSASAPQTAPAGLRVLLVEDNELNQMVARGMLVAEGIAVEIANDGAQALALLRRDARFSLVLMDVQMPVLDGLSATRLIRSELKLTLPIIAMSAGVLLTEREQCAAAGMDDFVPKPIDHAALFDAIRRHGVPLAAPVPSAPPPPPPPPRAAKPAAPGMIPGVFDVSSLVALNANQPERSVQLFRLIRRSLTFAQPGMAAAREGYHAGRADDALRELHNLRGVIGTVGAKRFMAATLAIEKALRADPADASLSPLFEQAESALEETLACGMAWLETVD